MFTGRGRMKLCSYEMRYLPMNLTSDAIEILKANPYIANVTEKTVRFTTEFKTAFWEKYKQGMAASLMDTCQ